MIYIQKTYNLFILLFIFLGPLNFIYADGTSINVNQKVIPKELKGSGLPLPRFASIKDQVNLRVGPGKNYKIIWVINIPSTPVEIIEEYDGWRKIRMHDNTEGWVKQTMLSGKRTVILSSDFYSKTIPLYSSPKIQEKPSGEIDGDVVAELLKLDHEWCHIQFKYTDDSTIYKFWVERKYIWGIYKDETYFKKK